MEALLYTGFWFAAPGNLSEVGNPKSRETDWKRKHDCQMEEQGWKMGTENVSTQVRVVQEVLHSCPWRCLLSMTVGKRSAVLISAIAGGLLWRMLDGGSPLWEFRHVLLLVFQLFFPVWISRPFSVFFSYRIYFLSVAFTIFNLSSLPWVLHLFPPG